MPKTIEETYKKLSQREHVLHRPNMYIGEVKKTLQEMWVFDRTSGKMIKKMIEYSPGFLKIFDEILTNATDHATRDSSVNTIKVDIDEKNGEISVWNNGSGVPIELHKEHNLYVPELIFGHLLSGSNYNDSDDRTGAGTNGVGSKCVLHSTLVPLFNGEIKQAKDIKIGDILIGDDGTQRKVLNKIEGFGEMYKIKQHYGEDYVVNNNHTLTLHMPDHKVIFWNENGWSALWWNDEEKCIKSKFIKVFNKEKECPECKIKLNSNLKRHYTRFHKDKVFPKFNRKLPSYGDLENPIVKEKYNEMKEYLETIPFKSVFDINIQDYLKLNETTQRRLAGVRGHCVQWPEKDVKLDPYILGLWLGDGSKCGRSFACYGEKDGEIVNSIEDWCDDNNALVKNRDYNKYLYTIHSNSDFGKMFSSPLRNLLKEYDLINNKHIPRDYIVNSRETRLKLLAGLIDTDGGATRDGTRIHFTQSHKHKKLIDDTVLLVRSLGFSCSINEYIATYNLKSGEKRTSKAYRLNISGNIDDIPTKLPRKKCRKPKRQNTDKTTGYIKIEKSNDDKYIGFEIDGNKRFVINDFTTTHNCTNIYSKHFTVETVDSERGLKFTQTFTNNMADKTKAKVVKNSGKSYTKITFIPDYERFNMNGLERDTIDLLTKRVYDCIVCTDKNVSIYLNGEKLRGKGLQDYTKYFFDENVKCYYESNEHGKYLWEWVIIPSDHFEQVSFVNGNSTYQGGKHVDHIMYQITSKLKTLLETKKRLKDVKPTVIKERCFLFLKSTISNPQFGSQTKEQLTTQVKDFGCKVEISDKFIDKIWKSSIVEDIVEFCKVKESMDLAKTTDGKKKNRIYVPKLEDALWAGTAKSDQCTLILTEGLSAMTFALWGRSIVGPERWGTYPLKGKVLNIRDATASQLMNNEEINNLKQILGLKQGKDYKDTKDLRYGKVMILTDADVDGSHIKALLVNLFHCWWPSLIKLDFIQTLRTPIVKAIKGQKVINFYTEQDYRKWQESTNVRGYQIRYFKGLGTSKKEDAQETFKQIDQLQVNYYYKDNVCDESIILAFEKDKNIKSKPQDDTESTDNVAEESIKCSDKRKRWLAQYDKNSYIDMKQSRVSYQDLIHKELIHFSIYDNLRSIPSLCDGLKPSQRKILYYMLKNNINKAIKVAQLSGYVSAETGYHHGEASLQGAIVSMAQNFVGSNNINLLYPDGNFGSRLLGGKDAASPRYIFTRLSDITHLIFDKKDSPLLTYLQDDGMEIEPEWFVPVLPMVLVNGCEGIGTGYSTYIPPYNPKDIIANLLRVLDDKEPLPMQPYFKDFNGTLKETEPGSYVTMGKWERISDTQIKITELPVGSWVTTYKEFLESMIESNTSKPTKTTGSTKTKKRVLQLKDVKNKTRDENDDICFIVEFCKTSDLDELIETGTLEKTLKLTKSFTTNNMYLFSDELILTKYKSATDILLDFYDIRTEFYDLRKQYLEKQLANELQLLNTKIRFINEYISGELDINRKNKDYIVSLLEERGYPKLKSDIESDSNQKSYDYLVRMPLISLSLEKITELQNHRDNKQQELDTLKSKTNKDLWKDDLNNILKML